MHMFWVALMLIFILAFGVGLYSYLDDKKHARATLGQLSMGNWLMDKRQWNPFGHYLIGLIGTVIFAGLCWKVIQWPMHKTFIFAMIPMSIYTLYKEFVADKHYRIFIGQDPKAWDLFYDLYTRFAGIVSGSLVFLLFI